MYLIPLILIPIVFLVTAITKPFLQKYSSVNICSVCVAVSLTWLLLLVLINQGFVIDSVLVGILMGMSVTGVMYKIEGIFKSKRLKWLWLVRLIIILGGLYATTSILAESWGTALLIVIATVISVVIFGLLMQGVTHDDALDSAQTGGLKKSLIKKLDNCC